MLIPVTEGGEAHGGRYKCYSPGEGHVATKKKGKHTGHTHGEKLTKERMKTVKNQIYVYDPGVKRTFVHFGLSGVQPTMGRHRKQTQTVTAVKYCTCIIFLTEAIS